MTDQSFVSLDIIDGIETWEEELERPTGSRAKLTVILPDSTERKIFKYAKPGREHQIWAELVASFIAGDLLSWPVQRVGLGRRQNEPGNLLQYMFSAEAGESLIEGWRFCIEFDPGYDQKQGIRHTWRLIRQVAESIIQPRYGIAVHAFLQFWARAIAFDTLISNTDRHAENWGIIIGPNGNSMAPLYDNATSLGCGIDPFVGLSKYFDHSNRLINEKMSHYMESGCHHLRLDEFSQERARFSELATVFLADHAAWREPFEAIADLNLEPVGELLQKLARLDFPIADAALSDRRARHMYDMLNRGRERVRAALKD